MLENLVTPVVAIAILLGITLPIWLLVLLVRLVRAVCRIAGALEWLAVTLQRAKLYGELDTSAVEFERTGLGQPK